jgi:hypothetical protein
MANKDVLELVFKHSGGVELRAITDASEAVNVNEVDTVIWASDSDPDFMDEFGDELLEPDADGERILEFLVDTDVLDDEEADEMRIFSEALDARDVAAAGPGDDDDDDDDEEDEAA